MTDNAIKNRINDLIKIAKSNIVTKEELMHIIATDGLQVIENFDTEIVPGHIIAYLHEIQPGNVECKHLLIIALNPVTEDKLPEHDLIIEIMKLFQFRNNFDLLHRIGLVRIVDEVDDNRSINIYEPVDGNIESLEADVQELCLLNKEEIAEVMEIAETKPVIGENYNSQDYDYFDLLTINAPIDYKLTFTYTIIDNVMCKHVSMNMEEESAIQTPNKSTMNFIVKAFNFKSDVDDIFILIALYEKKPYAFHFIEPLPNTPENRLKVYEVVKDKVIFELKL